MKKIIYIALVILMIAIMGGTAAADDHNKKIVKTRLIAINATEETGRTADQWETLLTIPGKSIKKNKGEFKVTVEATWQGSRMGIHENYIRILRNGNVIYTSPMLTGDPNFPGDRLFKTYEVTIKNLKKGDRFELQGYAHSDIPVNQIVFRNLAVYEIFRRH